MVCRSSRGFGVLSAAGNGVPLWPPRCTNSIIRGHAHTSSHGRQLQARHPTVVSRSRLPPVPGKRHRTAPRSMPDSRDYQIGASPRDTSLVLRSFSAWDHRPPRAGRPAWAGTLGHPVRDLRREAPARRRPRAITPGHSKTPPAGRTGAPRRIPGAMLGSAGGVELVAGVLGQQHDPDLIDVRRQRPQGGQQPARGEHRGAATDNSPKAAGCHVRTASGSPVRRSSR